MGADSVLGSAADSQCTSTPSHQGTKTKKPRELPTWGVGPYGLSMTKYLCPDVIDLISSDEGTGVSHRKRPRSNGTSDLTFISSKRKHGSTHDEVVKRPKRAADMKERRGIAQLAHNESKPINNAEVC